MSEAVRDAFSKTNFGAIDTVIVVAYLLISLAIGLMVKRYAGSMENYLGAGRKVGPWLGVATMTGTELGLVTVMYSAPWQLAILHQFTAVLLWVLILRGRHLAQFPLSQSIRGTA